MGTSAEARGMGFSALLSGIRYRLQARNIGVLLALIILCIVFAIASGGRFLTVRNFLTVARQVSLAAIVGVGLTFVMITANIDLAVGSYLAMSGIAVAAILQTGVPWYLATLLTMVFMASVGALVGVFVAVQRLNSLIVTLAMLGIARGLALSYSNASPIFIESEAFIAMANGYFLGIPIPVLIALSVIIVGQFILKRTTFGRYVYAVGGNEQAARSSGISPVRIKISVFALSGMLSGLAGCILAGRLFSGNPTAGQGFELDVVSAVVIGGTSLFGGVGGMWGTLVGAFTVGIIGNGLTILGVEYYYQLIAKGLIIYIAILIDRQTQNVGGRSRGRQLKG